MIGNPRTATPERTSVRDTGALVLAVGGLAAAFGVASCCALPLLLGTLGVSSAWLATTAWLATPYQPALLALAIACLAGGGAMLVRQRRVAACSPGVACRQPLLTTLSTGALLFGAALVALGLMYA
jgi:mercuric ion transport protein